MSAIKLFVLLIILFVGMGTAQSQDKSWKLYDDTQVAEINISMSVNDYKAMMNNPRSDSLFICSVHFKNAVIDDTVDNVGIRIRGNTSRDSQKKSFKLSFDDFSDGREFHGVDKLDLNGEHNDPSISRSKICWDLYNQLGITASRAAHAAVYINNVYNGLYISVEHIDNEFLKKNYDDASGNLWKCLYPADLTFKGTNPESYKYSSSFPAYELLTNDDKNDYTQLARLIKIINQTPASQLADSLESILNVYEFLKYEAMNVLVGGWDEYRSLMNNYYLYYEPLVKKFHWIPYDYDNTFGVDWFDVTWSSADPYNYPKAVNGSRPLADKIFSIPEYRNLYTHFIKFFSDNAVNPANLNEKIDSLRNKLSEYAIPDTFRTKDYGYTYNDFYSSFSTFKKDHVKTGIKDFIYQRYNSIQNQLSYVNSKPAFYGVTYKIKNDSIYVNAPAFDNDGIDSVKIFLYNNGINTEIYDMQFKPVVSNIIEETDRWEGALPIGSADGLALLKIEAKDKKGNTAVYPWSGYLEIKTSSFLPGSILINEFLADNINSQTDPANEHDDWVELYNPTPNPVTLTGMYLTDKNNKTAKWKFTEPNLILDPGKFIVVWCDENHNDNQPGLHSNFKLSKSGEFIGLLASDSTTWIDSLSFGQQTTDVSYGRIPDGSDTWNFLSPTPGTANTITDIKDEHIPREFSISVYPNPFNPSTTIEYNLPGQSDISIVIYDVMGKEIWSVKENSQGPGLHSVRWNGENKSGQKVSTGVYLCRVTAGKNTAVQKLILIK